MTSTIREHNTQKLIFLFICLNLLLIIACIVELIQTILTKFYLALIANYECVPGY